MKTRAGAAIPVVIANGNGGKLDEGLLFIATYSELSVANGANIEMLLIVGSTICKLSFEGRAGGAGEVEFYEGTTVSANGTGATRANKNRNSINNGTLQTFHSPTVTDDGLLLHTDLMPSVVGSSQEEDPWELKPNTNYLLRVINRAGSNQELGIHITWSE